MEGREDFPQLSLSPWQHLGSGASPCHGSSGAGDVGQAPLPWLQKVGGQARLGPEEGRPGPSWVGSLSACAALNRLLHGHTVDRELRRSAALAQGTNGGAGSRGLPQQEAQLSDRSHFPAVPQPDLMERQVKKTILFSLLL